MSHQRQAPRKAKPGSRSKNQPTYNAHAELYRITGVDLVAWKGISASLAQPVLSEVGTDALAPRWRAAQVQG
jgi:hypothetical protein